MNYYGFMGYIFVINLITFCRCAVDPEYDPHKGYSGREDKKSEEPRPRQDPAEGGSAYGEERRQGGSLGTEEQPRESEHSDSTVFNLSPTGAQMGDAPLRLNISPADAKALFAPGVESLRNLGSSLKGAIGKRSVDEISLVVQGLKAFQPGQDFVATVDALKAMQADVQKALEGSGLTTQLKDMLIETQWMLALQSMLVGQLRVASLIEGMPTKATILASLSGGNVQKASALSAELDQVQNPLQELSSQLITARMYLRPDRGQDMYSFLDKKFSNMPISELSGKSNLLKSLYDLYKAADTSEKKKRLDSLILSQESADFYDKLLADIGQPLNQGGEVAIAILDNAVEQRADMLVTQLQKEDPRQQSLLARVKRLLRDFLDKLFGNAEKVDPQEIATVVAESAASYTKMIAQVESALSSAIGLIQVTVESTQRFRETFDTYLISFEQARSNLVMQREFERQRLQNQGYLSELQKIEQTLKTQVQDPGIAEAAKIVGDLRKRLPTGNRSLYEQWGNEYKKLLEVEDIDATVPQRLGFDSWDSYFEASLADREKRARTSPGANGLIQLSRTLQNNPIALQNFQAFLAGPSAVEALKITQADDKALEGIYSRAVAFSQSSQEGLKSLQKNIELFSDLESRAAALQIQRTR
jgi:hypothetical protein